MIDTMTALTLLLNRESDHFEQMKLEALLSPASRQQICALQATSPAIHWINTPLGTRSLALIIKDKVPANTAQKPNYYWVVYNLPRELHQLPQGANQLINMNKMGWNSFGEQNYHPLCAIQKNRPLEVELIAVDKRISVHHKMTGEKLERKISQHALAETKLEI